MADDPMEFLTKSLELILTEKETALTKERQAIENLTAVLKRMGYGIVPLAQMAAAQKRRGRPPGRKTVPPTNEGAPRRRDLPPKSAAAAQPEQAAPKRRGRPPGSGRKKVAEQEQAKPEPKRRGRPPKSAAPAAVSPAKAPKKRRGRPPKVKAGTTS